MRLTADEYRRGLVSWDAPGNPRIAFQIGTGPTRDGPHEWSSLLTDPRGSKVDAPPYLNTMPKLVLQQSVLQTSGLRLRLERLYDNKGIVTAVWDDSLNMQPARLLHVPNYGRFHRLVVRCPTLLWAEDVIYRVGDIIVRFLVGTVHIERLVLTPEVELDANGRPQLDVHQETAQAEGRLIDIVAPGPSVEDAELEAYGILGLLALCLGENAVGEVVSSEPYEVLSAIEQRGTSRGMVRPRVRRSAAREELDRIDATLSVLTEDSPLGKARTLASRWFEKGLRADAPLDQLISFAIGIEAIVSTFARIYTKQYGELREEKQRRELWQPHFADLKGKVGKSERKAGLERLIEASFPEQFALYARERGLDPDENRRFRLVRKHRNDAIHGQLVGTGIDEAREAESLLRAVLKAELGISEVLPCEGHPRFRQVSVEWQYGHDIIP